MKFLTGRCLTGRPGDTHLFIGPRTWYGVRAPPDAECCVRTGRTYESELCIEPRDARVWAV